MDVPEEIQAMAIAVQVGVPCMWVGSPGVAKTELIEQIGYRIGKPVVSLALAQHEPSDLTGIPYVFDGRMRLGLIPQLQRVIDMGSAILFLDEFSHLDRPIQAAAQRVLCERIVGEEALPVGVSVVMAANPKEIATNGNDFGLPVINRMCILNYSPPRKMWTEWLRSGESVADSLPVLPLTWARELETARTELADFIDQSPAGTDLAVPKPGGPEDGKPYPTWRSWTYASKLLAACRSVKSPQNVALLLVSGCVGTSHALAFFGWLQERGLPQWQDLRAVPARVKGLSVDYLHRVMSALVDNLFVNVQETKRADWNSFWDVLEQMALDGRGDAAVAYLQTVLSRPSVKAKDGLLRHPIPETDKHPTVIGILHSSGVL